MGHMLELGQAEKQPCNDISETGRQEGVEACRSWHLYAAPTSHHPPPTPDPDIPI
jgi:hypothetical protein